MFAVIFPSCPVTWSPPRRSPYTLIGQQAGRAIALGAGAGGGAAGAGAGIGMLFGKVIESVTRQPEMRGEITSIQWLGFALTEATFFYGLVGGFIAFFI